MICKLCKRETREGTELCVQHLKARELLWIRYDAWREAYSDLAWEEYLDRVKQLKGTGDWVKEVIGFERKEKDD